MTSRIGGKAMDSLEHKERIQARFGASAQGYVDSVTHASGEDLGQIVAWAEGGPDKVALDIATGGGHTALALAPLFGSVVASDLTEPMLRSAEKFIVGRGATNVSFRQADAEALPFGDAEFDLVTCRIAPHHFPHPERFVEEVARVLKPGGHFILEDSIAPEDDALAAFLNAGEVARDPTHVRSLQLSEWRRLVQAAGLAIEAERIFPKDHPFENWLDLAKVPADARPAIHRHFREAPPAARRTFVIEADSHGNVTSYTDEKIVLKARRPERR
jgi:SAM-dependent methyltransferase